MPSAITSHAHHFDDVDQQREAQTVGMWVFLVTEVMFFGGLFLAYAVYRWQYPLAFREGSHHLVQSLGAINTGLLLGSSFTVALGVHFAQANEPRRLSLCLGLTILLGAGFLGIKAYEYWHEWQAGLVPGHHFKLHEPRYEEVEPRHVELFMGLYFAMTGLHATHMAIGLAIFSVLLMLAARGAFSSAHYMPVEIAGLYWHFVDIVWVFLFPLLYFVR